MRDLPVHPPRPTAAEWEILNLLWQQAPHHPEGLTVRTVHQAIGGSTAYTNTLKLMQIMAEKGLLLRQESGRAHFYQPAYQRQQLQKSALSEFVDRVFNGSTAELVLGALSNQRATKAELDEIRKLLAKQK